MSSFNDDRFLQALILYPRLSSLSTTYEGIENESRFTAGGLYDRAQIEIEHTTRCPGRDRV